MFVRACGCGVKACPYGGKRLWLWWQLKWPVVIAVRAYGYGGKGLYLWFLRAGNYGPKPVVMMVRTCGYGGKSLWLWW